MSWAADTLAAFKAWLGATTPPASDAQLTMALELALVTVENWLDRPLELIERTQEDWPAGDVIRLRAWPVDAVASIMANGKPVDLEHMRLDKRTGRLGLAGWGWPWPGPTVTTYTAGFDPFPADLTMALWLVAAELVPATMSAGGVDASEAIRRVTSPDAGTVEYATSAASGGAGAELLGGTLPPQAESLLARYRAESVLGGA